MNENDEKNTDLKSDEIKEQKTEELFFDSANCEETHVFENETEIMQGESDISKSGDEVSAEENIFSAEEKPDGTATDGNAGGKESGETENPSLSAENGFAKESESSVSDTTVLVGESENGVSDTTEFEEENGDGVSEEKLSDNGTVPDSENGTESETFGGEEDFHISDEEFSRALKNPMFPMFSRGRNESVEQSVVNFCKMIAAGKNSVSEEDRIRMTPYSGYGVVSDIALSERQKKIAREAGMSYREYYEIIKSLPKKSK